MSGTLLYPRLPTAVALSLIRRFEPLSLEELREESELSHPSAVFNPVGGHRVSPARLELLRDGMRQLADDLGFPGELSGANRGNFDRLFAEALYRGMAIVPGDAGHEGVWSFLSLVLAPELPVWRFPGRTEERLRGQPRNAFRRLWWRAHMLGFGQDALLAQLTEDQLVQIEERPTIAGDIYVARAVASQLVLARQRHTHIAQEDLMRETAKHLIRLTPLVNIHALNEDQLSSLVAESFDRAASALGSS
jgi:hypothetical protein